MTLTPQQAYEIGVEAYLYFYPLVLMDITRRVSTNTELGKIPAFGPMNTFSHLRAFPDADFKTVVRPNFDTLYSASWLDLTQEPMIVSAPETNDLYYLLPMLDMWTDVFAVPGKRTTGTQAGQFAIIPSGWQGELPSGAEKIQAPTPYVWIIGRTQTNGVKDYDAVHRVQDGFTITPLSQWGREPQPVAAAIDPTVDMKTPPLEQVNNLSAPAYFTYAAELMQLHPPHSTDWSILARMQRLGLEPGKRFEFETLDPSIQQALEKAPTDGLKKMAAKMPTLARIVNGWSMNTDTMGVYGDYYSSTKAC